MKMYTPRQERRDVKVFRLCSACSEVIEGGMTYAETNWEVNLFGRETDSVVWTTRVHLVCETYMSRMGLVSIGEDGAAVFDDKCLAEDERWSSMVAVLEWIGRWCLANPSKVSTEKRLPEMIYGFYAKTTLESCMTPTEIVRHYKKVADDGGFSWDFIYADKEGTVHGYTIMEWPAQDDPLVSRFASLLRSSLGGNTQIEALRSLDAPVGHGTTIAEFHANIEEK